ncbi:Nucleic acid-binding, OB-fold containing protein [Quillaja saponaria]|uniref:Nucleic acid-binding, OB-fold containing protein n=1 Tax=Quillaja saponaria TaxID=32244 RepID=A0AAD7PR50_QUISA|nr:Nucleic acid-binding, OB-fold containing protein [Quillaja saponaria]
MLTIKVVSSEPMRSINTKTSQFSMLMDRSSSPTRIGKCLMGDEIGTIIFTARNEQVDIMTPGATLIICNAKIDMFKGSIRLAVDKWGRVEVTEPANFSFVEYKLVNVVEE